MISKLQITSIFHKSNTSKPRIAISVADVTKMASIFKKYLGAIFFQKKNFFIVFWHNFLKIKCI